ncbi:MAG: TIGR02757 family protein [Marinilabiliaceae bacterium]
MLSFDELRKFLDEKSAFYESEWFVQDDPVQIPHQFTRKEDIEIAGFLTATITWGRRSMVIASAQRMLERMDWSPFHFVSEATENEIGRFSGFVYRTFNGTDAGYFLKALSSLYRDHGGLHQVFSEGYEENEVEGGLHQLRRVFMSFNAPVRTGKHFADVSKNATAKRLNMFLRWMVRSSSPVDFGLWTNIDPADLLIPLDVHVGRVARALGLLERRQNDLKAVRELTMNLKKMAPRDPVFYDYALFGLGLYENF